MLPDKMPIAGDIVEFKYGGATTYGHVYSIKDGVAWLAHCWRDGMLINDAEVEPHILYKPWDFVNSDSARDLHTTVIVIGHVEHPWMFFQGLDEYINTGHKDRPHECSIPD